MIDGSEHILVYIYNVNTESELQNILKELSKLMKMVNVTQRKQIVLAGHFDLFYDSNVEAKGEANQF